MTSVEIAEVRRFPEVQGDCRGKLWYAESYCLENSDLHVLTVNKYLKIWNSNWFHSAFVKASFQPLQDVIREGGVFKSCVKIEGAA